MYFLLSFALILTYLHQNIVLSIIIFAIIASFVIYINKGNVITGLIQLLIATIPISYYGINCSPDSHLLKWYNIVLFLIIIYMLYVFYQKKISFSIKSMFFVLIFLGAISFKTALSGATSQNLFDFIQIVIVIIPIYLFNELLKSAWFRKRLGDVKNIFLSLQQVIVATGLGVIYQYISYKISGKTLGEITFFTSRFIFDLLFTGYSVLSIFLGIGFIMILEKILSNNKFEFINIIFFAIILYSMILNTSRSGMLAAICISVFMVLNKVAKYKHKLKSSIMMLVIIISSVIILLGLSQTRKASSTLSTFFYANGREELAEFGLNLIFKDAKTFMFGVNMNLNNYLPSQHNMFLEIITSFGFIGLMLFLILLLKLLLVVNKSQYKYLVWHIIFSFQFVSSFFATTFIVPIVFVVLMDVAYIYQSHYAQKQS